MKQDFLKVLLVDDEENTRNLLKMCIDWEALQMQVIGDAASGVEALNLLEETKPDIVLTDIEMPYMDGISLSKQIMEHYIDIYVVIVTAHEKFSYAQQAISIGVSDFILKPINPDVITDTLKKISQKISEKRQKLTELEMSYKYFKNNSGELKNQFLNGLISGNTSNIELLDELGGIKLLPNTHKQQIQIALFSIIFDSLHYTSSIKQSIIQNCILYIEETFSQNKNLTVFSDVDKHIVLLCNDPDVNLPELCEQITAYFRSSLQTTVYCGIGTIVPSPEDIPSSYQEAKNALKLSYILDEAVVYNLNLEKVDSSYHLSTDNPIEQLILLIKSGLTKESIELASSLLQDSLQEGLKDLNTVRYYAIHLLSEVTNALIQLGIPASSLNFGDTSYSYIMNTQVYADIEKYTISTISEFCSIMNTINKNKQNDTISQVISYVEANFADENLSLTSLAKQFYINPSYLSRLFKKVTSVSFTDYLVELRVQKAIQLLSLSNYKAYQLAQMVGIPDPNYFIKCFRKVTGVSLQEFKAQKNSSS